MKNKNKCEKCGNELVKKMSCLFGKVKIKWVCPKCTKNNTDASVSRSLS